MYSNQALYNFRVILCVPKRTYTKCSLICSSMKSCLYLVCILHTTQMTKKNKIIELRWHFIERTTLYKEQGTIICNTSAFFLAHCTIFNMQVVYLYLIYCITDATVDLLTNNLKSRLWLWYSFYKKMSHWHTARIYMKLPNLRTH
jgi:hypothetical protein